MVEHGGDACVLAGIVSPVPTGIDRSGVHRAPVHARIPGHARVPDAHHRSTARHCRAEPASVGDARRDRRRVDTTRLARRAHAGDACARRRAGGGAELIARAVRRVHALDALVSGRVAHEPHRRAVAVRHARRGGWHADGSQAAKPRRAVGRAHAVDALTERHVAYPPGAHAARSASDGARVDAGRRSVRVVRLRQTAARDSDGETETEHREAHASMMRLAQVEVDGGHGSSSSSSSSPLPWPSSDGFAVTAS